MISSFRGEELFVEAQRVAPQIAALKARARQVGIPCVYVNDNFGRWRSNFSEITKYCMRPESRGRHLVELLLPHEEDYFVLKPKHSGFYQTPLELLLKHFGTERLILAGLSSNSCILFTANDAYMRDLGLIIPEDGIAACNREEHCYALHHVKCMLKADTSPLAQIDFARLLSK